MSKRILLNVIDLGGGTAKGCDCEAPDLSAYAKKEDVPTKVSELENDSGFVTSTESIFSINTEKELDAANTGYGDEYFIWNGDKWVVEMTNGSSAMVLCGAVGDDVIFEVDGFRFECEDGVITSFDENGVAINTTPAGDFGYYIIGTSGASFTGLVTITESFNLKQAIQYLYDKLNL